MTHTDPADGRHDFDFIFGTWTVAHRRLTDHFDPGCDTWETFAGTSAAEPVLGGLGNADRIWVPEMPDGRALEGYTLRLFDPGTATWRIWWASTSRPGVLDPPVAGRFADGVGRFTGDDVLGGRPAQVEFAWRDITADGARWEQAFSFDGGATWKPNWIMEFSRSAG